MGKKYVGVTNIVGLCKKKHSKSPIFYVTFFIEKMVTDSIQN